MATPVTDSIPLLVSRNNNNDTLREEFISGLVQGGSWTFGGGPRVLTYSLDQNFDGPTAAWPQEWVDALAGAFKAWASVANVQFAQQGAPGVEAQNLSTADIAIALSPGGLGQNVLGIGIFPDPEVGDVLLEALGYSRDAGQFPYPRPEGDISFDNAHFIFNSVAPGSQGYYVLLHEIGHALGLKHTDDNGINAGRPTFRRLGIGGYDSPYYTVMQGEDFPFNAIPSTPGLLDILAIQHIYGANMSYRTGNDRYVVGDGSIKAIWDAGGRDALVAGPSASAIDLNEGKFSGSADGQKLTAIAYGVTIEDAVGSQQADRLTGNEAGNELLGSGGNDKLVGKGGIDTLRGGAGNDFYSFDGSDVLLEQGAGTDTVHSVASHALGNLFENLVLIGAEGRNGTGNSLANHITGNSLKNLLEGRGGDDTLEGGSGNDTLIGGSGLDTLEGREGSDVYLLDSVAEIAVVAGAERIFSNGTDTIVLDFDVNGVRRVDLSRPLYNGFENVTLSGAGSLHATGYDTRNKFVGNDGNDTLTGGGYAEAQRDDTLIGGGGDDSLNGGAGGDLLYGDAGNDSLEGGFGYVDQGFDPFGHYGDTLDGGDGDDRLVSRDARDVLRGGSGNDELRANGAADQLYGEDGNDLMHGGAGDDTLAGGSGIDTMIGGGGDDVYVVDDAGELDFLGEQENGGADAVRLEFDADTLVSLTGNLSEIESVSVTGAGEISLSGNARDNTLTGNAAGNGIAGLDGNDTLVGLGGDDAIEGGDGDDSLAGGNGADVLRGGFGNDTLAGGAGADSCFGGDGDDVYLAQNVGDLVFISEVADEGIDKVIVSIDTEAPLTIDLAAFTSVEQLDARASSGTLTLLGDAGANTIAGGLSENALHGGGGNDSILGGIGNDSLSGDEGNDVLDGGFGDDVLSGGDGDDSLSAFFGIDTIFGGGGNDTLTWHLIGSRVEGGEGNDSMVGAQADAVIGGGGNDTIYSSYAEFVSGGDGDDRLVILRCDSIEGGAGDDVLVLQVLSDFADGGTGNDTLRFSALLPPINLVTGSAGVYTGFEVIDLGINLLRLDLDAVLDLSDTDVLRIDGTEGVVYRGEGWTTGADQVIGLRTYHTYTQDAATLLVDTDITSKVS